MRMKRSALHSPFPLRAPRLKTGIQSFPEGGANPSKRRAGVRAKKLQNSCCKGVLRATETREKNAEPPACAPQSAIADSPMQAPVKDSTKACQKSFQALRGLSPRYALGRRLFRPHSRTPQTLPCFRGRPATVSLDRFTIAGLSPNIARTKKHTPAAPARSKPRPADCCPRPSPRLRYQTQSQARACPIPSNTPPPVRCIASIQFTTLPVPCWRRSSSCRSVQHLAERAYAFLFVRCSAR